MNPVRWAIQAVVFLGILLACLGIYLRISRREPLRHVVREAGALRVRVQPVERRDFAAAIVCYGTAKSAVIHTVRAEVPGKVVRVSPTFAEGRSVREGETLFEIDQKDISIAILEGEAQLQQAAAALGEIESQFEPIDIERRRLEQEMVDLAETIRVTEEATELARAEVNRLERLGEHVSRTEIEQARLRVNQHEQASLSPRSRLAQIPLLIEQRAAEKKSLERRRETLKAQVAVAEAGLEKARLDVSRTTVASPADGLFVRSPGASKALAKGDLLLAGEDAGLLVLTDLPAAVPGTKLQVEE